MEIDKTLERVKTLISQREAIDVELASIFGGTPTATRKPSKCSKCGQEGHRASTCTNQPQE